MAKRTPDKFHVDQRCVFAMDSASGWSPLDGEPCVVVDWKKKRNIWCRDWDGGNPNFQRGTERYEVRWAGGELYVREHNLRAYDGGEITTWDEFARKTGLRLTRGRFVAVRKKEVSHE